MTPMQNLRHTILLRAYEMADKESPEITAENIDEEWAKASDEIDDCIYEATEEARSGYHAETGLNSPFSRYYEAKEVAAKMPDGSWVGWTYWYGGGKHGEPEAIDWMDDAYELDCKEQEKLVVVQAFTKK